MTTPVLTYSFSTEEARRMTARQRLDLADALSTLISVAEGLSCQPRFDGGPDTLLGLTEHLAHMMEATVQISRDAEPTTPAEAEERFWTVLRYEAGFPDVGSNAEEVKATLNRRLTVGEPPRP